MGDEVAVGRLDEPAQRLASDSSPSAPSIDLADCKSRDRGPLLGLTAWLLVAIAAFGMFVSTPPSAGPDEPVHEVTAWYLTGHGFPPSSTASYLVPASLWGSTCFAGRPDTTVACVGPRSDNSGVLSVNAVTNYPPVYYWIVGAGERLAALAGNQYADWGARLASIVLNLGVLFLVGLYMRRRNPWWGTFLVLVSTPTAVFLGVVVNPSGWETTCALVMAAALSEVVWTRDPLVSGSWRKASTAILFLASLALCLARPLGFMWASGLTVTAFVLAPSIPRPPSMARVAGVVAPGVILGILWTLTHPVLGSPQGVPVQTTIPNLIGWFTNSLFYFPERIRHMFGVLGWLDTPMPGLLLILSIGAWAALLTRLPSIRKTAMLLGILGIVILPSTIEAFSSGGWPSWWQSRYTLPFALGFVMLLLLRSGRLVPRTVSLVAATSLVSVGIMVWVNAIRYAYGLDGYDLPISLDHPAMGSVRLGLSAAVGLFLLVVGGFLLVRAARSKSDFVVRLETEPA
jgi:hypothetical protein